MANIYLSYLSYLYIYLLPSEDRSVANESQQTVQSHNSTPHINTQPTQLAIAQPVKKIADPARITSFAASTTVTPSTRSIQLTTLRICPRCNNCTKRSATSAWKQQSVQVCSQGSKGRGRMDDFHQKREKDTTKEEY